MTQSTFLLVIQRDLEVHCHYQGKPLPELTKLQLVRLSFNPYFSPVLLYRISNYLWRKGKYAPIAVVASKVNYFLFGIEIARQCEIGPGLYFPHTRGTVIGAASIGKNAVIYHGVTLGASFIDIGFHADSRPVVGDDVTIGAGAKIVGALTVGSGSKIGVNAVVVRSVAEFTTLVAPEAVMLARSSST